MRKFIKILPAFMILILGILISFLIQFLQNQKQLQTKENEIALMIEDETSAIEYELYKSFSTIKILQYIFENNEVVTQQQFYNYSAPLLNGNPSLTALSWVPLIRSKDRTSYEEQMQQLGHIDFHIKQQNNDNKFSKALERPIYFPVTYIEPLADNVSAVGYDIYSSGARKAAIKKSIETNDFLISSRIKLVQDTLNYSFLGIMPVVDSSMHSQDNDLYPKLKGIITLVYRVEDILSSVFKLVKNPKSNLVVFDITRKIPECIFGDENLILSSSLIEKRIIAVGGRDWELNYILDPSEFEVTGSRIYLFSGILISLFLFVILLKSFIRDEKNKLLTSKLLDEQKVRKVTEKSLSESEEYNRTLFSQSSIGLALSSMDGKLLDVNPAYANIIGHSVEEAKKLSYWDITPVKYKKQEEKQIKNLQTKGKYGPYEKEYIHKNGHTVSVRLQGKLIERNGVNYIWSSVEDITTSKKAEMELRNSENKYRALVEQSLTGIYIFEKEKFIYVNQRFCDIFGYTEEEVLSLLKPTDVISEVDKSRATKNINDRLSGIKDRVQYTAKGKHKQEKTLWIEIHGTHVILDNRDVITGTVLDITERRLAEEKISKLNEELEKRVEERTLELDTKRKDLNETQAALLNIVEDLNEKSALLEESSKKLKETNKELESFSYSVSHDLKAPLRGIDGYSKLLLDIYKPSLNKEAQGFITNIRSSTLQMNQLIEDLLDYSRLERTQLRIQPIKIKDLIMSVLSIFKSDLEQYRFKLDMNIDNKEIIADLKGLTIALRNILENAIKFSKSNPEPFIQIAVEETDSFWVINVKDNGIGFNMQYHEKIFEIFQRLQRAEDFPGTGIGLAMVSKAMQRMQGRVNAESIPGKGSVFSLEIPKKIII